MLTALAVLFIVWFTDMPLWVSVLCTVLSAIKILIVFLNIFFNNLKDFIKHNDGENDNDI